MRRIFILLLAASACTLASCASTITAWKSRAFAKHTLEDSLISMTADRRLAILAQTKTGRPIYCMEALPDVATAFASTSKPNANIPNYITLGTEDSFSTTLTKTYERSNETQFYRLAAFDNCILYAMGVIPLWEYSARMNALNNAAVWYIYRTPIVPKREEPKPAEKKPTTEELLVEIRDLLRKR